MKYLKLCLIGLKLCIVCSFCSVLPSNFISPNGVAVNGSSPLGLCLSFVNSSPTTFTCNDPAFSVLFDGNIPTLTGLDGDTWASQLLTLPETGAAPSRTAITFDFTATQDYTGLRRVEVVMFNCPRWGIAVQNIEFRGAAGVDILGSNPTATTVSCDSLVRVCIEVPERSVRLRVFTLDFIIVLAAHDWVHLAEVTFFDSGNRSCPPNEIITSTVGPTHGDIVTTSVGTPGDVTSSEDATSPGVATGVVTAESASGICN